MNYKQCIEFLELNCAKEDIPASQLDVLYNGLRGRCQSESLQGRVMLSFESGFAASFAMTYLERACKSIGVKSFLFSREELGDYRNRWRTCGKALSQKNLCEIVEQIKEVFEEEGVMPSIRQTESLAAELAFRKSDAKVLLTDSEYLSREKLTLEGMRSERISQAAMPVYKITKKNVKCQWVDFEDHKKVQIGSFGKAAVLGAYQALLLMKTLHEHDIMLEEKHLYKAFEEACVTAVFSRISTKPLCMVDGADDGGQARRLAEDIEEYLSDKLTLLVWGATKSTQVEEMLPVLTQKASCIITIAPPTMDRIPAVDLAGQVMKEYPAVTAVDSPEEAWEIVQMLLPKDGVVLIVGCPELLSAWMKIAGK